MDKRMELKEAKDIVAVKYGFKNWLEYSSFMFHTKVSEERKKLPLKEAEELVRQSNESETESYIIDAGDNGIRVIK